MSTEATAASDECVSQQEIICAIERRSAIYGLLSRLFRKEIDEAFLERLMDMRFPRYSGNDDMDSGYLLIATFLNNVWGNSLEELSVDYSRVFIGQGIDAYSAAYPFESVYTSRKRLLMQNARDEVLAIYRSEGLDKNSSWRDGEDHISLELEFQKVLCDRTLDCLRSNNEEGATALLLTQRNFLKGHLCSWIPMMTSDMKRYAQSDFYLGLAYLVDGFLEVDSLFLEEILG